jgi:hypothetical protein
MKRDPQFLLIQMNCLLLEKRAQMVLQDVLCFLSLGTPYY